MVRIRSSLAPGAANLLPTIREKGVNQNKKIRELNVQDFAAIVQAFSEWPFAPEVRTELSRVSRFFLHTDDSYRNF